MGLSDRLANEDTAIKRTELNENIEVSKPGRYYPEEFNDQINIVNQTSVLKGEIPKSLANITEHYDDFKISTWASDEDTAIQKKAIDAHYDNLMYKQQLNLDMLNQNYDMYKRMQSDIDNAIEYANNNEGVKVEDEVARVVMDYKNPEDIANSPAAQRQWQSTHSQFSLQALSQARAQDFQNSHLQAQANMQDIINSATNLVISGKTTSPADGMKQLLPQLLEFKGAFSFQEWSKRCNEAYSKLVHMEAIRIEDMFKKGQFKGGAEEAVKALNDLCTNYRQISFDVTDKSGNVTQMTFTLDAQTQEECWKIFNDAKSGGDPADDILTTTVGDWETQVGWQNVQNGSLDNNVPDFSIDKLDEITNKTIDDINMSNASVSSKAKKAKEIFEKAAVLRAQLSIGELYMKFGANTGLALQETLNKLNTDLKNNTNFDKYTLNLPTKDGKSLIIGSAGFLEKIPQFGDGGYATREYWTKYRDTLQSLVTTLNNQAPHNIISDIDSNISALSRNIPNNVNINNLVEKIGNSASIKGTGVQTLVNDIRTYDSNAAKYNIRMPLNDKLINGLIQKIETSGGTPQEQQCMYRAVASALAETNHITDIIGYSNRNRDGMAGKFITALAQTNDSKYSKQLLSSMTELASDPQAMQTAKDRLTSSKGLNSLSMDDIRESGILGANLHISKQDAGLFSDMLAQAKLVAAYTQDPLNRERYCKELMRGLIDPMYVKKETIKGIPMSRPFKYSPQMAIYKGDAGERRMASVFRSAIDELNIQKENGRIPSNYNISIYSDNQTGSFYYMINNKRIQTFIPGATTGYIGQHLENETTKNYSSGQVGIANALKFISDLGACDTTFRNQYSKNSYMLTKEEMKKAHPSNTQWLRGGLGSRTYNQVVNNSEAKVAKDFVGMSAWWNNADNFEEAVKAGSNKSSGGSVQRMHGEATRIMSKGAPLQPTAHTGFTPEATTIMNNNNIRTNMLEKVDRGSNQKSHILGFAVNITESADEIISYAEANMTHATKVNQDGVSIPITHASINNEDYIDVFNATKAAGIDITDAYIPNVTNDYYSPSKDEGVPTGFAVDLNMNNSFVKSGFDGTKTKVPTATAGKNYTKNEMIDLIDYYADVFQVPRRLAHAMTGQESGYQQKVTSYKGAHGVMQLMPGTAKSLGVTNSSDAAQNIWGGMNYIAQQFRSFGSWPLALAAYNAGPDAVKKAGGIPNFSETKNYVKNIMAKAGMDFKDSYSVSFELTDKNMNFMDNDTGSLSRKGVNNLIYLLNNSAGYKGKVICVYTDRPELLSNDKKYADFAEYRTRKGSDGKPLFRKGNVKGFQVQIKSDSIASDSLNPVSISALADSVASHQCNTMPTNDRDSVEALISTFSGRYNRQRQMSDKFTSELFGLANLSASEYSDYGVPLATMANPEMQARVLNQEFQRARNILGSDRKAIFAIAGGDLRDSNGIIKSWAEVKRDAEAFRKNWYIQPSEDAKRRDEINTLVSTYDKLYNNIRGRV